MAIHWRVVNLPGASASKKTYTSSPRSHQLSRATHPLVGVHHPPNTHTMHFSMLECWVPQSSVQQAQLWVPEYNSPVIFRRHCFSLTQSCWPLGFTVFPPSLLRWCLCFGMIRIIVTMTKSWTFDFCFIILALYCVVIEMLKKSLGHFMREELLPHPKAQKSWMYCIYIYTN